MKNWFVLIILISLVGKGLGQESYTIKPLFDLNTSNDELACTLFGERLVVMKAGTADLVNDYQWTERPKYSLESWARGIDYSKWNDREHFFRSALHDIGPATYCADDSLLFFSSVQNFGSAKGHHLKLYSSQWNGWRWEAPEVLPMVDFAADYTHPHYVQEKQLLIFSSNSNGGCGGMDLWFCMKTLDGWSQPVNLGLGVNTPANEIFPTYHAGDIYYATNAADTWGGYDIRRASGTNQWKTAIAEGAPMNSAADDVCVLFLSDDKAILTSNRAGGLGGDDLFLLTREARPEELHDMMAELEFAGQRAAGVELMVRNDAGEIVQIAPTNELGKLDIRALRLNQTYTFQLNSPASVNLSEYLLVIKDPAGNRLTEVRFNLKGIATLELLPFQFSDTNPLAIRDESLLNLSFEGQLYEEKPGDIGRGEPITILNSKGEPVAIAYTNDTGKFRFTKLDPQLNYVMRLSEQTEATHAIITSKGNKIDIPVLNAEVNYTRIAAEDAITLVNEFNDTIQVSPEDLFVINRIYYAYNSAQLTAESRRQLEQLAIILERNSEINLELRSHTDSRGDADYNLRLSQQRAKSAIQYMVEKGLDGVRFQLEGLGETQPLNECVDGVSCSEPEYAINRRTEIRLRRRNGLAISESHK
jgi:outer membrane protein OmpA-like peptidoglycan-associated protein